MKPLQVSETSSRSCSCTLCSDSDRFSKLKLPHSRVVKKYHSKHDTKGRKLLLRPNRFRNNNIEDGPCNTCSSISFNKRLEFKPNMYQVETAKEFDNTFVNYDKYIVLGPKKISNRTCTSQVRIHEHLHEGVISKSHMIKHYTRQKYKKGQRLRTKHIRSDPCTCNSCLSNKCEHSKCEKRIKRTDIKSHSMYRNRICRSKSASGVISKFTLKEIQPASYQKVIQTDQSCLLFYTENEIENIKLSKQAVHVKSLFDFDIEFNKGMPTTIDAKSVSPRNIVNQKAKLISKSKRNEYLDSNENKYKKEISSTCLCALKIGRIQKEGKKLKCISKRNVTSRLCTDKNNVIKLHKWMLPNECNLNICSSTCDHYKCNKHLNKKERNIIYAEMERCDAKNRKVKSASSFTTRSITSSETKKVYSSITPLVLRDSEIRINKEKVSITGNLPILPFSLKQESINDSKVNGNINNISARSSLNSLLYGSIHKHIIEITKGVDSTKKYILERRNQDDIENYESPLVHTEHDEGESSSGFSVKRCLFSRLIKDTKNEILQNKNKTINNVTAIKFNNSSNLHPHKKLRHITNKYTNINDKINLKLNEVIKPYKSERSKEETSLNNNKTLNGKLISISQHKLQSGASKQKKKVNVHLKLKRCLYKAQLQNKKQQPDITSSECSCINKLIKSPRSYTVSRVTVTQTKIFTQGNLFSYESEPSTCGSFNCDFKKGLKKCSSNLDTNTKHCIKKSFSCVKPEANMGLEYKEIQSYFPKREEQPLRLKVAHDITTKVPSQQAVRMNSNFSFEIKFLKETNDFMDSSFLLKKNRSKRSIRTNILTSVRCSETQEKKIQTIKSRATGKSPFLKQCFCTMNFQVSKGKSSRTYSDNNQNTNTRLTKHILKPYECEPGVCTPGECDPVACQKLILQRLRKKVSKLSGTESSRLKSTSSHTSKLSSKAHKIQFNDQSHLPKYSSKKSPFKGIRYETLPIQPRKQAVRVGSNFSFNIEFSKDVSSKLPLTIYNNDEPESEPFSKSELKLKSAQSQRSSNVKHRATKNSRVHHFDQGSQSLRVKSLHKKSSVNPMLKRCFCTLKLHKTGRHTKTSQKTLRTTITPPNTKRESKTANQNTDRIKHFKFLHALGHYECEPNICVPGQCNPYECLELIKKRNVKHKSKQIDTELGRKSIQTDTESGHTKSTNSRTSKERKAHPNINKSHVTTHDNQSKKSVIAKSKNIVKPSQARQAVRIGSSFNFEVDFFKEKSHPQQDHITSTTMHNDSIAKMKDKEQHIPRHKSKDIGLQDFEKIDSKDSQTKHAMTHAKSSMRKSFLQRCFFTAKLHSVDDKQSVLSTKKSVIFGIVPSNLKNPRSFLHKCLCTLKTFANTKEIPETVLKTSDENTQSPRTNKTVLTHRKTYHEHHHHQQQQQQHDDDDHHHQQHHHKHRSHVLEPYECEPRVCEPGKCDPLVCEQRIKKRNMHLVLKVSGTDGPKTKSVSSSVNSSKTSKGRKTQSSIRLGKSVAPRKSSKDFVKKKRNSLKSSISPDKQAVRIGSNFSFSIEFFKERSSALDFVPKPVKVIKEPVHFKSVSHKSKSKLLGTRNKATKSKRYITNIETQSRHSQAGVRKKDHASGVGSMLKRCFCTLKLHNESMERIKSSQAKFINEGVQIHMVKEPDNQYSATHISKSIMTKRGKRKHSKIKPYECEPGVCVPGECNPHECEKLIKKRLNRNRDSYTSTNQETKSMASTAKSVLEPKVKSIQFNEKENSRKSKSKDATSVYKDRRHNPKKSAKIPYSSPSRQSVTIGSSFSFNIEFFKDKTPYGNTIPGDTITLMKSPKNQEEKQSKVIKFSKSAMPPKVAKTEKSLQYQKNFSHSNTQIDDTMKVKSTMTPLLKRCFCTLSLNKSKDKMLSMKKVSHATFEPHRHTKRELISENKLILQNTRHAKTQSKAKTLKHKSHVLEPYECEPNVCIPGQCDPYECLKRIKKRHKRDLGIGTEYSGKNSVGSSSETNTKALGISATPTSKVMKVPIKSLKSYNEPSGKPYKQAVRIGSNFRFDIEFFKDRSQTDSPIITKLPESQHKNAINSVDSGNLTPVKSVRHKESQRLKSLRDIGSQGLIKNVRSTITSIRPLLKRCFCTLKLHKLDNITSKSFVKETSVRGIGTDRKLKYSTPKSVKKNKSSTNNKATHTGKKEIHFAPIHSLEPYECEPGVCVPGQCDPYICEKRILKRNKLMHTKMSSTEIPKTRSASSHVPSSKRSRSIKIQSKSRYHHCHHHHKLQSFKHRKSNIEKDRSSGIQRSSMKPTVNSQRQSVRIGSNFSFDIEFFKDRSPEYLARALHEQDKCSPIPFSKPIKNIDNKSIKNKGISHTPNKSKGFNHIRSQTMSVKKENQGSVVGPLLKRCFCTLKLQKIGRQHQQTPSQLISENKHVKDSNIKNKSISKSVSTRTKRKTHVLEPYECEPNFCVPGQCDPHVCYERIKKRHMKSSGTKTEGLPGKSVSTLTFKTRPKSKSLKTRSFQDKESKRNIALTEKSKEHKVIPRHPHAGDTGNRQAVRVGSDFSFNIEFFKERSARHDNLPNRQENNVQFEPKHVKQENTQSLLRLKSNKSNGIYTSVSDQSLQVETVKKQSKSSSMEPLLKRCFCTLTLHNTQPKKESITKSHNNNMKSQKVSTGNKSTLTKLKRVSRRLDPFECEPGICIPGECDPYVCDERIKKRRIRRKSRKTGTHMIRHTNVSLSNMTSNLKSLSKSSKMQSDLCNKDNPYISNKNESVIVEEPRFPFAFGPNRQVVSISSNFSFNITFSKEKLRDDNKLDNENLDYTKKSKTKSLQSKLKSIRHQSNESRLAKSSNKRSQMDTIKTEDKASSVGKVLKRCFCTLKLQKQNPRHSNRSIPKDVKEKSCLEKDYVVYYMTQPCKTKCVNAKTFGTNTDKYKFGHNPNTSRKFSNFARKSRLNEMQTILPYTPRNFNNNISKTQLSGKNKLSKVYSCKRCCLHCNCKHPIKKRNISTTTKQETKRSSRIKHVLCQCRNVFSKDKKISTVTDKLDIKENKNQKKLEISQKDTVKSTKSVRRTPTDSGVLSKKTKLQAGDADQKPRVSKNIKIGNNMGPCQKCISGKPGIDLAIMSAAKKSKSIKAPKESVNNKTQLESGDAGKIEDIKLRNLAKETDKVEIEKKKTKKLNGKDKLVITTKEQEKQSLENKLKNNAENKDNKNTANVSKQPSDPKKVTTENKPCCTCSNKKFNFSFFKTCCDVLKKFKRERQEQMHKEMETKETSIPLFEVQLDFDSMCIVNTDEVKRKITELEAKDKNLPMKATILPQKELGGHGKSCSCCYCVSKGKIISSKFGHIHKLKEETQGIQEENPKGRQKGAKLTMAGKGRSKKDKEKKQKTSGKNICVCGSKVCAKEAKKKAAKQKKEAITQKKKPCICGNKVCANAKGKKGSKGGKAKTSKSDALLSFVKGDIKPSQLRNKLMGKVDPKGKDEKLIEESKRKRIKEKKQKAREMKKIKKALQERKMRQAQYKREDAIRRKKRLKEEKFLESKSKAYKNTSDVLLIAESVLDLAKLSCTAMSDVLRATCRAVTDPKRTCQQIKTAIVDPHRIRTVMKEECKNTGVSATCRRVRVRLASTKLFQKFMSKMDQHPITNFIVHMGDKDPTARMKIKHKRKKPKKREKLNFGCSPFMISLRKRPFLAVYYLLPWFYPHFLSLLNVLRQFRDLLLFLLAVLVWTPCILCTELCRAFLCCFVCTE